MPRCASVHPHAHMCPHTPHTKIFYHAGTMRTRERSIMGKNGASSKGKIARVWRQVHREEAGSTGPLGVRARKICLLESLRSQHPGTGGWERRLKAEK